MKKSKLQKNTLYRPVLFLLLLAMSSCGLQSVSEPAAESTENGPASAGDLDGTDETEIGRVPVADFAYMVMDYPLNSAHCYTINGEWLYYAFVNDYLSPTNSNNTYIARKRISDGYVEANYIESRKEGGESLAQTLLADAAGNCYIFWKPGYRAEYAAELVKKGVWDEAKAEAETGDMIYSLAKYGTDGEELWHVDYAPEDLEDMGDGLYQGTVTEDGRVFLYTHGSGGRVFAFGEDGILDTIYAPDMEWLEGVAVGKGDRVYAYGSAGSSPLFTELGGTGETYACPVSPLEVYSGYQGGVFLRTGESMWRHDPETGEAEFLWNWKDEYVQLDNALKGFFYDGESCRMLFTEQEYYDNSCVRNILTVASVAFGDPRDYPGKQTITLSSRHPNDYTLDILVKLYNRQSKKYKVEVVQEGGANSLEMKLLQRKGSDLIELTTLYADNLAEAGAFEDLTPYYENSGIVRWEDILEPVREACVIRGRNVAVIPSFHIKTMLEREAWYTAEEWNVLEFLKMAQGKHALPVQDPLTAFRCCMGIRYGEHFVDYENRECRFDSEEFRQVLEACGKLDSYSVDRIYYSFENGDYLLVDGASICSIWDMVSYDMMTDTLDESYSSRMVGHPGWDGGEHELYAEASFAMNSMSENKEGAWDFLEYLLSEELQDIAKFWYSAFPVRTDSFEKSLEDLYYNPVYLTGFRRRPIPTQADIALLREMMESAVYQGWSFENNQVRNIVEEEVQMYFAGDSPLDETVRKIQNRVQLYLDEM